MLFDVFYLKLLQIFTKKLHKSKVTHCEFSPREDWMFVTGSLDKTVQVWDIRAIKDKNSYLIQLKHEKPINSGQKYLAHTA